MSTLQVGTIKSASSAAPVFQNSSGTEKGQLAKFWVAFQGTGTVSIESDFNVSSITDNGTGDYTISFDNSFSSNVYCVHGSNTVFSNGRNGFRVRPDGGMASNQQAGSVRTQFTADGGMTDQNRAYVSGFGVN